MADEIELKFLDIDKDAMIKKIEALGAEKKYDEVLEGYKIIGGDCTLNDSTKDELRVRKIGDKIFLTFKGPRQDSNMTIREELEVEVSDMETTKKIMERLGFATVKLATKRRIHYELGETHFEIELFDFIPPYLEIETHTTEAMEKACKQLTLDIREGKIGMISEIYPDLFKKVADL